MKTFTLFLMLFAASFINAQERIIRTGSKGNNNYIFSQRDNKGQEITYLNKETDPFTGKIVNYSMWGKAHEENYVKGIKTGEYLSYGSDSTVVTLRGSYCGGNPCGEWIEYQQNKGRSMPGKVTNYDDKGAMHGLFIMFHDYSSDTSVVQRHVHGKGEGQWTWYYLGGKLKTVEQYKDGKRISFTNYNEDGTLKQY